MIRADQAQAGTPYSGTDNLEVMKEAVNCNRYLLELIRKHAGDARQIVDFGAGVGTFAVPAAQSRYELTAIEIDEGLRAHLAHLGLRTAANPTELPPGSFDYAYTLNVLEHITDDVTALGQLRAILKPGARLLIYVPAFPVLYSSMDAKVGHVRRYTRHTLVRSVAAAGFTVDRVEYADSLGFFAALAFKLMDRGGGSLNLRLLKLYDRLVFPLSRALDRLAHRWVGKNLVVVASNPATPRR